MYVAKKTISIALAHRLGLNYKSKHTNLHGHTLKITIYLQCDKLNHLGMVADLDDISKFITETFDHKYLNTVISIRANPTLENLARIIAENMPLDEDRNLFCCRVDIEESESVTAQFIVSSLAELEALKESEVAKIRSKKK